MQGPMIQDQSVTGRELGRDAGGDSDAGESAFGLAIGNGYTRAPQIVQNMLIHSKQVGGHSRAPRPSHRHQFGVTETRRAGRLASSARGRLCNARNSYNCY